ncbi:globin [Pseudoalteromonas sp. JBTF-M23]|uniref:Globin n=1 Tax=Pseudoalteromonas caenipelagi TaxID=2726988 RepID=A0A849VGB2_9GAMM|nr:globin [Pseudoalteromonas caenipelagi]NOU52462.1 globin [Pseudoalteromonas caenipelagi]
MSISPYQYQLLTQSFATLQPNFHCFCVSLRTQLNRYEMQLQLPQSNEQLITIEHRLSKFIQEALYLLPQQEQLAQFIYTNAHRLAQLKPSERDISVLCNTMITTLQLHLGAQFTLALRNAWRKALHIFANIIKSVLFKSSNVVCLGQFRAHKQKLTSTIS